MIHQSITACSSASHISTLSRDGESHNDEGDDELIYLPTNFSFNPLFISNNKSFPAEIRNFGI